MKDDLNEINIEDLPKKAEFKEFDYLRLCKLMKELPEIINKIKNIDLSCSEIKSKKSVLSKEESKSEISPQ